MDAGSSNLDSRGRRKSSPSAGIVSSHKIHNVEDPDGAKEEKINRLAARYCKARKSGNEARALDLRVRLITGCMKFFYVSGEDVTAGVGGARHAGHSIQVDEIFQEVLMRRADEHDDSRGAFTHDLRYHYGKAVSEAARRAAKEDSDYGGGKDSAPASLDAGLRRDGEGSARLSDMLPGEGEIEEPEAALAHGDDDAADDAIVANIIALITDFYGRSGRAANDTRKLYTRMFFSETLTRMTKTRTVGELGPLQRRERELFGAIELPFQDYYTASVCRSIAQLWKTALIEGLQQLEVAFDDTPGRKAAAPNYGWSIPGALYVSYLGSIGMAASAPLVSQQRQKYKDLLGQLRQKGSR